MLKIKVCIKWDPKLKIKVLFYSFFNISEKHCILEFNKTTSTDDVMQTAQDHLKVIQSNKI